MELMMRKDVPEELTWDLNAIYATEEDMLRDAEKMEAMSLEIEKRYKGKLNTAEQINACLDEYRALLAVSTLVSNYSYLAVEVDYLNAHNKERNDRIELKMSEIFSRLSFIASEILEQDTALLEAAADAAPEPPSKGFNANSLYLKKLLRLKPHRLQPETERVLATLSPVFNTPYRNIPWATPFLKTTTNTTPAQKCGALPFGPFPIRSGNTPM